MSLNNNCPGTTSGCVRWLQNTDTQPELIPDPLVDIACYSEPMDLGSVKHSPPWLANIYISPEVVGTDPWSIVWIYLVVVLDQRNGSGINGGLVHMRPPLIPDPIADILVRFVTIGSGIRFQMPAQLLVEKKLTRPASYKLQAWQHVNDSIGWI